MLHLSSLLWLQMLAGLIVGWSIWTISSRAAAGTVRTVAVGFKKVEIVVSTIRLLNCAFASRQLKVLFILSSRCPFPRLFKGEVLHTLIELAKLGFYGVDFPFSLLFGCLLDFLSSHYWIFVPIHKCFQSRSARALLDCWILELIKALVLILGENDWWRHFRFLPCVSEAEKVVVWNL